jgi:hypothetical protein
MSFLMRIIQSLKTLFASVVSLPLYSIQVGLPGILQPPGTNYRIADHSELRSELEKQTGLLAEQDVNVFDTSVNHIMANQAELAVPLLRSLIERPPYESSACAYLNLSVALAMLKERDALMEAKWLISVAEKIADGLPQRSKFAGLQQAVQVTNAAIAKAEK